MGWSNWRGDENRSIRAFTELVKAMQEKQKKDGVALDIFDPTNWSDPKNLPSDLHRGHNQLALQAAGNRSKRHDKVNTCSMQATAEFAWVRYVILACRSWHAGTETVGWHR